MAIFREDVVKEELRVGLGIIALLENQPKYLMVQTDAYNKLQVIDLYSLDCHSILTVEDMNWIFRKEFDELFSFTGWGSDKFEFTSLASYKNKNGY